MPPAGTSRKRERDDQHLTVPEVRAHLDELENREIRQIRKYEEQHKHRKGVLTAIDRKLKAA